MSQLNAKSGHDYITLTCHITLSQLLKSLFQGGVGCLLPSKL